jgi:hypothetical protein
MRFETAAAIHSQGRSCTLGAVEFASGLHQYLSAF